METEVNLFDSSKLFTNDFFEKNFIRINFLDKVSLINQLKILFEEQLIFLNNKISLSKISKKLNIRADQLSELVNFYYNKNFSRLLNEYRIKFAMEELQKNSDKTILRIALESGFNSKSNFNLEFKKITGMTPSQFRILKQN